MLSHHEVKEAVKPLRILFWGGILCVFDINVSSIVNGEGFKLDFLNDFVGMLMITYGVFKLSKIFISNSYQKRMLFVKVISVFCCIDAFHGHLIYKSPEIFSYMGSILGLCSLIAMIVFCNSMLELSKSADLLESVSKWTTTRLLFILIYLLPLGLFYLAGLIAMLTGESFNINLGPAGLLLLPVFFIPLFFIFKSTSVMKREIEGIRFTNSDIYQRA